MAHSPPTSRNPPLLPWLVLGALVLATYLIFYLRPELFWYVGVQHYDVWFADTLAILASNDAVAQGLNAYAPNPLDYFGRPHVYSHWWLGLRHLGLTRADLWWLGPSLVLASAVAAWGWTRPRGPWQFVQALAVFVSAPFLLGFERANNDLVILLILTPLVPCLVSEKPWLRCLAPVLVALAAGLKYYPAAAGLALLAPVSGRPPRALLVGGVALLGLTALSVAPDLALFGPLAPQPSGWLSFGAATVFTELGWTGAGPAWVAAVFGLVAFAAGWRADGWSGEPGNPFSADRLRFVVGAALLAGCFLTSVNFAYRWVFAIWLLPFLWARSAPGNPRQGVARLTLGLLLLVLWQSTLCTWVLLASRRFITAETLDQWLRGGQLASQPAIWALFGCLIAGLARFTRDSLAAWRPETARRPVAVK